MANFNGTQVADLISGTNDDDVITGLAGDDTINGAAGDDSIDGGAGADNILGGAGNDSVAGPDDAFDTLDGGDDTDTLVTDLSDGDDLTQTDNTSMTSAVIDGVVLSADIPDDSSTSDVDESRDGGLFNNFEFVQVSNANDFLIDLASGEDQYFALDVTIDSEDFDGSDITDLVGSLYDGSDDSITIDDNVDFSDTGGVAADDNDKIAFDQASGIIINGTAYEAGDEFETENGGTVVVGFADDRWTLTYTAQQQSTIDAGSSATDEVLEVQAVEADSDDENTVDFKVTLTSTVTKDVDLSGEDDDFIVNGSGEANILESGDGDDTIFGGDGEDEITLNDGNNRFWAGAGDTDGDTITIKGDGDNIVAGGAGEDTIIIEGDGANQAWGGADNDDITIDVLAEGDNTVGGGAGEDAIIINGDGNNTAWAGAGNDSGPGAGIAVNGDGDNTLGGGEGEDFIIINGDGNNTIFGGNDEDYDQIVVDGDGNNTVFGGGTGTDGDGNTIYIDGEGDNIVFNGGGDDIVAVTSASTGNNVLYGAAGDDVFNFEDGDASATIIFEAGNGADSIEGFIAGDADHKIDLSDLGFADANDVLDSITQNGDDAVLFVTAGQTVTFVDVTVAELQGADPADWLIL